MSHVDAGLNYIVAEKQSGNVDHLEKGEDEQSGPNEGSARQFDPALHKSALRKMDVMIMPIVLLMYLFSSLDKSNLGNAKTLGMIKDIGKDPTGSTYALLNSFYFIAYAPFMIPFTLLGKRTRASKVIAIAGLVWGTSATCFAAVHNFPAAFACRFFVGFGEAGFGSLVPFYLARWYTKKDLGTRVAFWLAMAPMGGFFNGIIAYGVSFIHSHIESWRILFLIEGLSTVTIATLAMIVLPEDIATARWFTDEEKEYLTWRRSFERASETTEINWKHARAAVWRWQTVLPALMYSTQQISGAALAAFLPTFTSENGYKGANAQIATLAPYGSAAVSMILLSFASDYTRNRGWFVNFGYILMIAGFGIYLGVPATNHAARTVALIFAESGHYISTPLILVWLASNCGNESRRAVAIPLANSTAQAIAVASGYLFPSTDSPLYVKGNAICTGLSALGCLLTLTYQIVLTRENRKRDQRDGKPSPAVHPDTNTFADDAPGFRYQL